MEESATPETGTETVAPEPGPMSDEKALDLIGKQLESPVDQQAPEEKQPESTPSEESQAQAETEEGEVPPEEKATPESEETEQEAEEVEAELPESFSDLAEALEVAPDELAQHLKTRVKVNGEELEVTLAEALKGYSREADYTQGTQRLAEERKALEAERTTALTQWQQNVENLESLATAIASQALPQVDLVEAFTRIDEDGLQQFDAAGYHRAKAERDALEQAVYGALNEAQTQRQQMTEYQSQQVATFRQEQQRLAAQHIPALRDPEGTRKFEDGMAGLLKSVGFTDDEVSQFTSGAWDHRYIRVIEKAMGQSNLEKGKKTTLKKLKAKPKVQKPGAQVETNERTDRVAEARKRLKRSSSRKGRDAAALDIIDSFLP